MSETRTPYDLAIGASLSALGLASLYELEQASRSKGGVSNVWVMWEFSRSLGYDFLEEFKKAAWSTIRRKRR